MDGIKRKAEGQRRGGGEGEGERRRGGDEGKGMRGRACGFKCFR